MSFVLASLTQRISAVDSVGVSSEYRLQHTAQLVSDDPVNVTERDVFYGEQLTTDPVHCVILVYQDGIGQLVEMSQRQH